MKKNVGLLVHSMFSGGAERVVSRLSHILSDEHNVFVILFEDTYMEYECGGTMVNMGIRAPSKYKITKLLLPFKRALRLKEIKRSRDLDLVISFLDSPNIVNILARTDGCKTIISIRNFSSINQNFLLKKINKVLYSTADCVISVSKLISEKMVKEYGISAGKAVTIYNPYDIEQIKSMADEEMDKWHEEFFAGGYVFISVGRQVYQKGFWHLIKAFKLVHDKYARVRLVIVGSDDGGGKAAKLATDLGLTESVLFTGYQENPFKYIARSSMYVLSSLFEGFPNAMVEAMACGCPVIAVDCNSGPREILYENAAPDAVCTSVEKADFGILAPSLDPKESWDHSVIHDTEVSLAEAMHMCIEDRALNEYYAGRAAERAGVFSYERCRQKFDDVINGS